MLKQRRIEEIEEIKEIEERAAEWLVAVDQEQVEPEKSRGLWVGCLNLDC